MDISLFNPAVIYFSVSLPFDEILDHTSSITAFAQAFDGVLVVIIQGGADGGRLMVLRVARNENVWRHGRWEAASAASSVGGSGLARNLDFALLCLPFLQSRQCLLRLVHGDAQQRILGAASECLGW